MNQLLELFLTFARVGVLTFGGGYAMLPILTREVVDTKHWVTENDVMDYYAVGQCTPGVIAVNTATFVGYKVKGVAGGICATLGVVFPSLCIITAIAAFIRNFAHYPAVKNAFAGIRVCVCVLILQAILRLWKKSVVDALSLVFYLVIFLLHAFGKYIGIRIPAALLVILAGAAGILISTYRAKKAGKEQFGDMSRMN